MKSTALFCFFGLFCGIIGLILKEINPKFSALFAMGSGTVFLFLAWQYLSPVAEYFRSMFTEDAAGPAETLFKALGMAALVSVTADLCRDMGEKSAAEKVELCGKAALALMALPLLKEVFSLLRSLI